MGGVLVPGGGPGDGPGEGLAEDHGTGGLGANGGSALGVTGVLTDVPHVVLFTVHPYLDGVVVVVVVLSEDSWGVRDRVRGDPEHSEAIDSTGTGVEASDDF